MKEKLLIANALIEQAGMKEATNQPKRSAIIYDERFSPVGLSALDTCLRAFWIV